MSTDARVTTLEQAMAELAQAQARTQASFDRTQANIDRLSQEMRESRARDDARSEETARLDAEFKVRDDARREETARLDAEFHAEMRAMGAQDENAAADHRGEMAELSRKMGTLTEDIVAPGVSDVFRDFFHVDVEECLVRQKPRHKDEPGHRREFDVVAWAGDIFLLISEPGSTLRPIDIDEVLAALGEVRAFFPEAEGRRVAGALASFRADPSLVQTAERRGLLVFGLSGGLMDVLNTPGFKPHEF